MKNFFVFLLGALVLSALVSVGFVPVVLAHAEIESCTPAIDSTVETAPDKVVCKASQGMKAEGEHDAINNVHVQVMVEGAVAQATAAPTPEATATPTPELPATGGELNFGLYARLAVFGVVVLGAVVNAHGGILTGPWEFNLGIAMVFFAVSRYSFLLPADAPTGGDGV